MFIFIYNSSSDMSPVPICPCVLNMCVAPTRSLSSIALRKSARPIKQALAWSAMRAKKKCMVFALLFRYSILIFSCYNLYNCLQLQQGNQTPQSNHYCQKHTRAPQFCNIQVRTRKKPQSFDQIFFMIGAKFDRSKHKIKVYYYISTCSLCSFLHFFDT